MRLACLLAVWIWIAAASPAFAECLAVQKSRLFSSQSGGTYVRVDLKGASPGRSVARLYDFGIGLGEERLVWTTTLVNVPERVWVDPIGRWVVTLGNFCNSPSAEEHALTVYDHTGQLIADWTLRQLAPNLRDHGGVFNADTPWTSSAQLRFEAPFDELLVFFPWGESKVVNWPPGTGAPGRAGGTP